MQASSSKECRLNIRCNGHARELLDRAASYTRLSVSEFVLTHALNEAEKVVQAQECITLAADDFQAFLAALDAPATPNLAMQQAMQSHAQQVVV